MDEQYIAIYDTLMQQGEMNKLCASAIRVGSGLITDYTLDFAPLKELPLLPPYDIAMPTLKRGKKSTPVAVYTMSKSDEQILYRHYRHNGYYNTSCRLQLLYDSYKVVTACTYILSYNTDDDISVLPHDALKSQMITAYMENGFDDCWIDKRFY